jgi:hypothetical protein
LQNHVPEKVRIAAQPQWLAAGDGHVVEDDAFGRGIRIHGEKRRIGATRIEVGEDGRALVPVRMPGIVNVKFFDPDLPGHDPPVSLVLEVVELPAPDGRTVTRAAHDMNLHLDV